MTEDVKPDYYSLYETRPTTPLPNAAHQITMDVYLEKSRNMSMKENNKLSRDTQIKKILLDLFEKYPDMWEVTDMNADKERWQELGVELYSFTGKVVGESVLRLMFGNMKGLMKRKLSELIDNHGSSHQDMEIAIREWELYRHFRWYRRHISEYEQALWAKKEVLDVVETDEVVYLGQYCNSNYVLQDEYNPAAVHHDEEMEYEDDSEETETMEVDEAPVEAPVRNAQGQQDEDVEDIQDDAQNEEMDEEEDDHFQDCGNLQDELDGFLKEDQAEESAPAASQGIVKQEVKDEVSDLAVAPDETVREEVQEEAVAAIVEQVPAQFQTTPPAVLASTPGSSESRSFDGKLEQEETMRTANKTLAESNPAPSRTEKKEPGAGAKPKPDPPVIRVVNTPRGLMNDYGNLNLIQLIEAVLPDLEDREVHSVEQLYQISAPKFVNGLLKFITRKD